MITKTTTTTTEALEEDRRRVQGIRDDDGDGSGPKMGLVDWQRQQSVDFPCYRVANSNTISSLSRRCLILVLFSSDSFCLVHCKKYYQYCNHTQNIFVSSVHYLAYVPPTYRRVKKLRVLMINKDTHTSLAHKNGNDILIWIWNNSLI